MKRTRSLRHARPSPRVNALAGLAESYAQSASRLEDQFWEEKLDRAVIDLIEERDEEDLNLALDQLYNANARAYDALADNIESHCEATQIDDHDIQLIAVPLLAWSRYNIPAVAIPAAVLETVSVHLCAHVLAKDAKLSLLDHLFSPDQLPQGFCSTAELLNDLGRQALSGGRSRVDPDTLLETMTFLADSRYIIGAVAVPRGKPIFRWQEGGSRTEALRDWQRQGAEAIRPLMTGCVCEFLLPQPYFTACRETDRSSRPFSLQASVEFLKGTLNVPASRLRAVVAPFHDKELEEYRVGFTYQDERDVLYGVVWPLLEAEDDNSELLGQIETLLKAQGIDDILVLDYRFPMEYCDDCGSPLYPNPDGEPVHAEMPEEHTEEMPRHLH